MLWYFWIDQRSDQTDIRWFSDTLCTHSARMTCKPWKKPLSCTTMPLYIWFYGLLIRRVFHFPLFLLVSATWENDLCSWLQYYPHLLSLFFLSFFLPPFLFSLLSLSLSIYLPLQSPAHAWVPACRLPCPRCALATIVSPRTCTRRAPALCLQYPINVRHDQQ